MSNHYSDFSSSPKFTRYYGLSDFPEAMFLIEAEGFTPPEDKTISTKSHPQGILFALGMTATLILLSAFQLYRSFEVTPAQTEIASSTSQLSLVGD